MLAGLVLLGFLGLALLLLALLVVLRPLLGLFL